MSKKELKMGQFFLAFSEYLNFTTKKLFNAVCACELWRALLFREFLLTQPKTKPGDNIAEHYIFR